MLRSPSSTVSILLLGIVLCGCTAADLQQLQQAHDQTASILSQAQAAQQQIQQQLTTLPADDPVRKKLEPLLTQLEQVATKAQSYLPLLDAAIKNAGNAPVDPSIQQAVSALPYGSLALAFIGVIFGVIKHVQAGNLVDEQQQTQKAFAQIASALDAALPNPTPEQKAKVDAVLDSDVKARLASVRSN